MVEDSARSMARKILPGWLRRPLGTIAGRIYHGLVRAFLGWIFDLTGGRFKADGCIFEIPRELTTRTYRSCFLLGEYEAEERELIRRLVRPEDHVLEAGACLGVVSCVTNRLLRDRTRHIVVEGNPELIPWIERNRALNGAGFTIEPCAVSSEPEVTFFLHPEFIVGGTTQRVSGRPVQVKGKSLRELHEQHGPFNALIMDIEGAELDALKPFAEILRSYRLVIVELHPWAIGENGVESCRQLLATAGLRREGTAGLTEAWVRD